jgi:hypothetical protein
MQYFLFPHRRFSISPGRKPSKAFHHIIASLPPPLALHALRNSACPTFDSLLFPFHNPDWAPLQTSIRHQGCCTCASQDILSERQRITLRSRTR